MQYSRHAIAALYGISAIIILQYSGADSWLANTIFQLTQGWGLRQNWWLNSLVHHGGRKLITFVVITMIVLTVISYYRRWFNASQRLALLFATTATLLNMLMIAALKHFTTLPCPWDVQGLGGNLPYLYLHQMFDTHLAGQQCFPAGHASGGYALFSLYFAALFWYSGQANKPATYKRWLLPAFIVGGIFGVAQQLRGAHFLSHDVTTALLCWYSSGFLFLLFLRFSSAHHFPRQRFAVRVFSSRSEPSFTTNSLMLLEKPQ